MYGTAPYYHDGSAPTLKKLVSAHEDGNPMTAGADFTKAELGDLVAFLKSL